MDVLNPIFIHLAIQCLTKIVFAYVKVLQLLRNVRKLPFQTWVIIGLFKTSSIIKPLVRSRMSRNEWWNTLAGTLYILCSIHSSKHLHCKTIFNHQILTFLRASYVPLCSPSHHLQSMKSKHNKAFHRYYLYSVRTSTDYHKPLSSNSIHPEK